MMAHQRSTPQAPARVVILGGSGFIGRDLTRHFSATGVETLPVTSAQINLCEPDSVALLQQAVRRDDTLVVTSALTPDKGKDARTFMRNAAMGEHLGEFLQQAPCAHLVYLSSDAVYADEANPVRETSCASASTLYGLMHAVREQMLTEALARSETPLCILRPCAIYGPGDTHNAYGPNRFLRSAMRAGTIALFGEGEEQRDHVFVEDVSRFIGLCVTHRSAGVLNIATGTAVSFGTLAKRIAELCDGEVRIEPSPRRTPVTHRHFDTAALRRAFPAFQMTPLSKGLAATYDGLREREAVSS